MNDDNDSKDKYCGSILGDYVRVSTYLRSY